MDFQANDFIFLGSIANDLIVIHKVMNSLTHRKRVTDDVAGIDKSSLL